MQRWMSWILPCAAGWLLVGGAGCRSVFSSISLLAVEQPLRLALVTENPAELVNPFSPYDPLLDALSKELGQRVWLEPAFPFQAGPQLLSGSYKLALATPAQYALLERADELQLVAVASRSPEQPATAAVLVVKQDSAIQSVEDLRGRRAALAEEGDSRSYHAARHLLREHGLKRSDLAPNPLLVETVRLSQRNALARVQLVLEGAVDAAFIDETEWRRFPPEEAQPHEPCQSKLRIVARTMPVTDLLVLASPDLPEGEAREIRRFLLATADERPELLEPLPYARFWAPDAAMLETCGRLRAVIAPPSTAAATTQPAPATQPKEAEVR